MVYAALAAGIALLGMGIALKVQSARLASCKQEFAGFQAQVKALGDVAEAKAKATELADKAKKEKIDRENIRLRSGNADLARSLRDARAGSGYVPAAAPGARNPATACFDRPELERAVQQLDAGVSGVVEKGDQARIDLDAAREWAK